MPSHYEAYEYGEAVNARTLNQRLASLDEAISNTNGLPTGAVIISGDDDVPAGWLLCDGTAVSRTTYADLFTVIGTTYGVGDGSTTFTLPDLRGRTPIGEGMGSGLTNRTLGQQIGEETHLLTIAEMPAHTHSVKTFQQLGAAGAGRSSWTTLYGNTSSAGNDVAHNNMQPSLFLNYLIRA